MRFLLDTHLLLWIADRSPRLPAAARAVIEDATARLMFSVVSIWEVAIKSGLGRHDFRWEAHTLRHGLLDAGYAELPITGAHAVGVATLPRLHSDPFDRILVVQALVDEVTLLTADPLLARYPAPIRLV